MARREFGTIFQRKGSRNWYIRFFIGKGPSQKRYERAAGRTKEIAKDLLRRIQDMDARGRTADEILHDVFGDPLPDSVTFCDAMAPYLEYVRDAKRPSTSTGYAYTLGLVAEADWAALHLDQIRRAHITRWLDERRRAGRSPQTLNNYLVAISGLFRWAIERGMASSNPASGVRWRHPGPGRETYLSAEESRALVAAASPAIKTLIVLALSTGMRRGEMLALRWIDVDLERRTVKVTVDVSKTHRLRVIPMTDTLHAHLAKHALARKPPRRSEDLVFSRPGGEQLARATVRAQLKRTVASCDQIPDEKKPKVTMHTLRHTAASLMVAGGRPIFDVAKILGHQSVKTTMRYAHFSPEAGRDTIETLGKMLDLDADVTGESGDLLSDAVERFG